MALLRQVRALDNALVKTLMLTVLSGVAACAEQPELSDSDSLVLLETTPGYATTAFGGASANRCVVNPVRDLNVYMTDDPSFVISYNSGHSPYTVGGPYPYAGGSGDMVHRQGIQRWVWNNTNYLLVSSSLEDGAPYLPGTEIIQMGSHPASSVRLGSAGVTTTTPPNSNDEIVARAVSNDTIRMHAGGMQVYGKYLAQGFEKADLSAGAYFQIFDLSTFVPGQELTSGGPIFRQHGGLIGFPPVSQMNNACATAMTRTSDGNYLVMVFGQNSTDVEVFTASGTSDLRLVGSWTSRAAWPTPFGAKEYQNMQLITMCPETVAGQRPPSYGPLYLVGTHGGGSSHFDDNDDVDLWSVTINPTTYQPTFTLAATKNLKCSSINTGNNRYCDFDAGAGAFVDSLGHLTIYGVEHYNDAWGVGIPAGSFLWDNDTAVKVREF